MLCLVEMTLSPFSGLARPLTAPSVNVKCLTQTVNQGLAFIYTSEITALFLCACGGARRNTTETAGVSWVTVLSLSQPAPEVSKLPGNLKEKTLSKRHKGAGRKGSLF